MRTTVLLGMVMASTIAGCRLVPDGSFYGHAAAQKLSDSYMFDLIADRVDSALDKMEPQALQVAGGKEKAEAVIRDLFNYCRRPLESDLRHEETGFFMYADGRKSPMRTFYYSSKTTQNPKGVCFFAVRIVPGHGGMKVVNFGPLKLVTGQLPEWARN